MFDACGGRKPTLDTEDLSSRIACLPPPEGRSFREGLHARLADVERQATSEVERLVEALASLRAENEQLRSQLRRLSRAPLLEQGRAVRFGEQEMPQCPPALAQEPEPQRCQAQEGHGSGLADEAKVEQPRCLAQGNYPSVASAASSTASRSHSVAGTLSRFSRGMSVVAGFSKGPVIQTVRRLAMKRKSMTAAPGSFYKSDGIAARIVQSPWFEYTSLFVVMLNALWISIDLDYNGLPLLESPGGFQAMEHFFVTVFTLEIIMRFMAYRDKWTALFDKWFIFDSTLVLMMIIESWVLTAIVLITKSEGLTGLGVLSALRILRLLRLARLSRLFKVLPELRTMISGMLAGIRSVFITAIILLAMTYIFAIVLRQLGHDSDWGRDSFSSVPRAIYTLLIESMLPDNGELLGIIGSDMWYCGVIYAIFLMFSAITVMNMLIGILCDVVGQVSSEEKEEHALEMMGDKLQAILKNIDKDYDGMVSKCEFESMIENEEVIKILLDVGVDVQALVEDADDLFSSCRQMAFEDFKQAVLMFRKTTESSARSILALRKILRTSHTQIMSSHDQIMRRLKKIEKLDEEEPERLQAVLRQPGAGAESSSNGEGDVLHEANPHASSFSEASDSFNRGGWPVAPAGEAHPQLAGGAPGHWGTHSGAHGATDVSVSVHL